MLAKWNGKLIVASCLLNLTLLGLPHIKKGRLWSMAKSTWKTEFQPLRCLINKGPEEHHAKREVRAPKNQQGWT